MTILFRCLICNEMSKGKYLEIPMLYNDNCSKGSPICNECNDLINECIPINKRALGIKFYYDSNGWIGFGKKENIKEDIKNDQIKQIKMF